jgi:PilZ domain-containing protein
MNERRAEPRLMCSDLVTVELENQGQTLVANLEDISPSGACLEMQQAVPAGAKMVLDCSGCRFRGKVKYCVFNQTGYQVGVQLTERKWSKENYEPEHLLDAPLIHAGDIAALVKDDARSRRLLADLMAPPRTCCGEESCPRADLSLLMESESPLTDRTRVVARAVAWTCEELSPENIKKCFSRWFQLPPECSLCDEFVRTYQAEYAVVSSQPAPEKRMAAGSRSDDI